MLKGFSVGCAGAVCALLLITVCFPVEGQRKKQRFTYPLLCADIKAGGSSNTRALRLYGKGYYVLNEGHGGGRYFVDPKHKVTLHIVIGADSTIDTVEYQQGVHLPVKPTSKVWRQATTSRLTTNKTVQGGYGLGTQAHDILRRYGKPTKNRLRNGRGILEYDAEEPTPDVFSYEAKFRFQNNRLVSVSLYNGE